MTETPTHEVLSPEINEEVERLLKRATEAKLRVVTAESCTGGLVASLLTDVNGVGRAFERGFITYTIESKHEMLGVPMDILEDPGPVSEVVARAMAEGALAASHGDIAIAVTGFAGPGAPGDEPGLVHFGLARRDQPTRHRREHFAEDDRAGVRLRCVETVLSLLDETLG